MTNGKQSICQSENGQYKKRKCPTLTPVPSAGHLTSGKVPEMLIVKAYENDHTYCTDVCQTRKYFNYNKIMISITLT